MPLSFLSRISIYKKYDYCKLPPNLVINHMCCAFILFPMFVYSPSLQRIYGFIGSSLLLLTAGARSCALEESCGSVQSLSQNFALCLHVFISALLWGACITCS